MGGVRSPTRNRYRERRDPVPRRLEGLSEAAWERVIRFAGPTTVSGTRFRRLSSAPAEPLYRNPDRAPDRTGHPRVESFHDTPSRRRDGQIHHQI